MVATGRSFRNRRLGRRELEGHEVLLAQFQRTQSIRTAVSLVFYLTGAVGLLVVLLLLVAKAAALSSPLPGWGLDAVFGLALVIVAGLNLVLYTLREYIGDRLESIKERLWRS